MWKRVIEGLWLRTCKSFNPKLERITPMLRKASHLSATRCLSNLPILSAKPNIKSLNQRETRTMDVQCEIGDE